MGSSDKDMALRINFQYQYKIIFGTFSDPDNKKKGKKDKDYYLSPDVDENDKELFMTILPASYDFVPKVDKVDKDGNPVVEVNRLTFSNAIDLRNKFIGIIGLATSIAMYA